MSRWVCRRLGKFEDSEMRVGLMLIWRQAAHDAQAPKDRPRYPIQEWPGMAMEGPHGEVKNALQHVKSVQGHHAMHECEQVRAFEDLAKSRDVIVQ